MAENDLNTLREMATGADGRWERLHDVMRKLRLVLENPRMRPAGGGELLEQLERRFLDAQALFPIPDWLDQDLETPAGLEGYFANHMGALIEAALLALERYQDMACAEESDGEAS